MDASVLQSGACQRPDNRHAAASSALVGKLLEPFQWGREGPGGWWIFHEPELRLNRDVLVPDLAGWKRARMPVYPDEAFFSLAPAWACEVISPATAVFDRMKKMPVYMREQVDHVWLIDPLCRALEVFRREGDRWVLAGNYAGDERIRAEPFEAVELELEALWLPSRK